MKRGEIKWDRATWLSGLGLLVVLGVMGLMLFAPPEGHGRAHVGDRMVAISLASAIEQFEAEYGRLPDVGSNGFDSDDAEGRLLAEILLGKEADEGPVQNPERIPFLSIETAKSPGKRGIGFGKKQEVVGIYDGWGEPFQILLRKPGERGITLVHRGKTVPIERPAVVFSKGKDRIAGTKDDVRTWD